MSLVPFFADPSQVERRLPTWLEILRRGAEWRQHKHWLARHIHPDNALDDAHVEQLLWLADIAVRADSHEIVTLDASTIAAYLAHAKVLQCPEDLESRDEARSTRAHLRVALRSTKWWTELVTRWERWHAPAAEIITYTIRTGIGSHTVRGTRVGLFAVREIEWNDALEAFRRVYRLAAPPLRAACGRPRLLYLVDDQVTGLGLGTLVSQAVAFDLAARLSKLADHRSPLAPWGPGRRLVGRDRLRRDESQRLLAAAKRFCGFLPGLATTWPAPLPHHPTRRLP